MGRWSSCLFLWFYQIPYIARYIMLFKILKSDIQVKSFKLICELLKKTTTGAFFLSPMVGGSSTGSDGQSVLAAILWSIKISAALICLSRSCFWISNNPITTLNSGAGFPVVLWVLTERGADSLLLLPFFQWLFVHNFLLSFPPNLSSCSTLHCLLASCLRYYSSSAVMSLQLPLLALGALRISVQLLLLLCCNCWTRDPLILESYFLFA